MSHQHGRRFISGPEDTALLRHVWPLIVAVIGGRGREPRASTTSFEITTPVALPEGMTLALNFMLVVLTYPFSDANRPRRYPFTASSVVKPMATVSACAAEAVSPASDKRWPRAAQ
jgi:hypothetical protein